ncbi:hypothetical protein EJ06DRAFT_557989 [Trichodelitschia bisporula]|uniref:Uncharacterized protein n=1 Tax=Trichodelitschia bisporula TaxID=703511 RepID=A0A6G1HRX2_9PEZI|nr:hypothetical protein EJ06DRAFT_557989 [Trichodelitschia bisporula]
MPHKHKRKDNSDDVYNLPPTQVARPLPTNQPVTVFSKSDSTKSRKRKQQGEKDNDTPRAFQRLMRLRENGKIPSGLDNGETRLAKKRKQNKEAAKGAEKTEEAKPVMKILPGESMADFSARVNQALPIAGLAKKGKKVEGVKERTTRHNKKLQKLVNDWKKEDAKIKEKEEEALELAEEEEDEKHAMLEDKTAEIPVPGKKGKKAKRKRVAGEIDDDDDDPWKVLEASRTKPKIHDVAKEPPQFTKLPTEKFKVRNGAKVQVTNVPNAAGSLRRREELGEERKSVIEKYRQMMGGKHTD